jgi:hypothetical protein
VRSAHRQVTLSAPSARVVLLVTEAVCEVVKDDYEGRALDAVAVRGREEPGRSTRCAE